MTDRQRELGYVNLPQRVLVIIIAFCLIHEAYPELGIPKRKPQASSPMCTPSSLPAFDLTFHWWNVWVPVTKAHTLKELGP